MHINKFYEALDLHEVEDFLLGKGKYFYKGNEMTRGEENHDATITWWNIRTYLINYPEKEKEIFLILDKSMLNILHNHSDAKTLENCVMHIWRYLLEKKEKKIFTETWLFSPDLLKLLRDRYNYYLTNKTGNAELDERLLDNIKLFKERFNFDIC